MVVHHVSDPPSGPPILMAARLDGGVMNRRDIARAVSNKTEIPFETVDRVLQATSEIHDLALCAGERVTWRGFGSWRPIEQKATIKTLPKTLEKIEVPARRAVRFEPAQRLLDHLNGKR
jgi:DNA-binding protein HU-beta